MSGTETAAKKVVEKTKQSLLHRLPNYTVYTALSVAIIYYFWDTFEKVTHDDTWFIYDGPWPGKGRYYMSFGASLLYLVFVHGFGPVWVAHVKKNGLGPCASKFWQSVMIVWNLFLAFSSVLFFLGGAYAFGRYVVYDAVSVEDLFCDPNHYRWRGNLWVYLTMFSIFKYVELFDTAIIIARGRMPDFLHWYHHVSVLIFTWFAAVNKYGPGTLFGIINAFVHSVMYEYYMCQGYNISLTYGKRITQIQIFQMFLGIGITGTWTYFHLVKGPAVCPSGDPWTMIIGAAIMYASYLFLFMKMYLERYNAAADAKRVAAAAKKSA